MFSNLSILEGMTFGSQFNSVSEFFDATLPTLEDGLTDRINYFDLNAGLFWRTMIRRLMPSAGVSVSHLNMPVQKFSTSSTGTRLHMKLNVNGGVMVPVSDRIALNPSLIYSYTPGTNEFLLGSTVDYSLSKSISSVQKAICSSYVPDKSDAECRCPDSRRRGRFPEFQPGTCL